MKLILRIVALALVVVCVPALVLVVYVRGGPGIGGYRSFVRESHDYHVRFAEACTELLRKNAPTTGMESEISGTNSEIPQIIRQIGATRIHIANAIQFQRDTNLHSFVIVRCGDGRMGYSLMWSSEEKNDGLWTLSASQESISQVVLATNLTTMR